MQLPCVAAPKVHTRYNSTNTIPSKLEHLLPLLLNCALSYPRNQVLAPSSPPSHTFNAQHHRVAPPVACGRLQHLPHASPIAAPLLQTNHPPGTRTPLRITPAEVGMVAVGPVFALRIQIDSASASALALGSAANAFVCTVSRCMQMT